MISDEKFIQYANEHGLVVVSRELYNILIEDHIKMLKLKKLTDKYEVKNERR